MAKRATWESGPISLCTCANGYRSTALLFQTHVLRRLFESYYVQVYTKRQTPVVLGLAGLSFYMAVPTVWAWGRSCCHDEGSLRSAAGSWLSIKPVVFFGWRGSVIALFLAASFMQSWAHWALARVRQVSLHRDGGKRQCVASTNAPVYAVLDRFAFSWSTCPHYLAEMVIYGSWTGFLVASGCRRHCLILPFLVHIFVVLNLSHTARASKRWLQQHYPNDEFVRQRAALVPGLF
jgi:hypothetical protein